MKKYFFLLLLGMSSIIYAQNAQEFTDLYGDYLGQSPPGDTPVVFAPGIVSTVYMEHSALGFSPDGNEVFWRVAPGPGLDTSLYNPDTWISSKTMRRIGDRWTVPMGSVYGGGAVFSPDGKRLYFSSLLPNNKSDGPYFVEKQGNTWSKPKNIGLVARFPELKSASWPSITNNGTLYFGGDTVGSEWGFLKDYILCRAKLLNGEYTKLEFLPCCINLPHSWNYSPFIAPDESYLIFSSNRPGSLDNYGDLYISFHDVNADTWSEPINMGAPINTRGQESSPGLSSDGKYLFFTGPVAGHQADIFWVSTKVINDIKRNPNIAHPIPNQLAYVNREFSFEFPLNTFWDFKDTTFTYSAILQNGDPLPGWLTFNSKTRTFSGTPSAMQVLPISLTAEDSDKNRGSGNFQIAVVKYQAVDTNKVDLEKDLVVNYTFDGSMKDKSSHNYHGEVHGAVLCEDRNGKENSAYFFDGKDDFIEVQHVKELEIIGALSVSCWVKPLSYETSYSAWISKQNTDKSTSQFRFGFGQEPQNRWGFTLFKNGWRGYEFDNKIPLDKWSHVLLTLNMSDNTLNIYLNGELVHTTEQKQFLAISDESLFIGYQTDNRCYFHGCIDDVVIYDRILNSKEVMALYREGL